MTTPQEEQPTKWQDRIVKDPQILAGKPVIKGTRISVELITDFLEGGGSSKTDLLKSYPHITLEDIDACIRYKATGAKLSNFTWDDLNAWMDEGDGAQSKEAKPMTAPQEEQPANWQDRIVKDPQILAGKPIIKGTRISVELITDFLDGGGSTKTDLLKSYPHITLEDIDACIRYKATGAKLSNFTWDDLNAWMDEGDGAQSKEAKPMTAPQEEQPANWQDRIVKDPQILAGKPIIKGTRISVELITDFLDGGSYTIDEILEDYSHITREDIDACIRYKATGAKLSNFTWDDLNAWMDEGDRARGKSA